VHDTRAAGGDPVVLSRIHGVLRDMRVTAGAPASLTVEIALPDNGTLTARGTATFEPASTNLVVSITDAPLGPVAAYIPASSAVQVGSGRFAATLRLRASAEQGVRISGELHTTRLEVYRRGGADPFLIHPRLDVAIDGLRIHDGVVAVERLGVSGHPTFVDHSVRPAVRWEVAEATGTITELSWPSGPPARVRASARLKTGGRSTLEGTIRPSPLDVTARVRVHDLPATRLNAYLPASAPARVADGVVAADVRVEHVEDRAIELAGTVTAAGLAVHDGDGTAIVTDPSVRLAAAATVRPGGGVVLERATLDATPSIAGVALRALHLEVGDIRWPATTPARLRATARLPGTGMLEASGTVRIRDGDVALTVAVEDAALGPWSPLFDVEAPVAGQLDARFSVAGSYRRPESLTASGQATAREIRVGPDEEPAIRVSTLAARGVELVGGKRLHLDTLMAEGPAVIITRANDGSFPILGMLGLRDEPAQNRRSAASEERSDPTPRRLAVEIDHIAVENGYARFVDRTTSPPFTHELRRISAVVRDLDGTDAEPAALEVDAVVDDGGALHLAGTIAPFAEPFVLDVAGTLNDFRVPATNPYLRETFGWIARRGRLTTEVRYRVVGTRLEATNDVLVENLAVRRAAGEVDPRIGVPLGLIVALLKNARGDIEVSVPVTGDLGRPEFGVGDALARAARQLVGKVITGPFRAIGRALRGDDPDDIADLGVDPVHFPEGSARLPAEAHEHLRRVGDFLRETPHVGITLRPVVARDDLEALRREAAVARVQRHQREQRIADFETAARSLAGAAPQAAIDTVLETLAAREPLPIDAAQRLAAARAAAAREVLAASHPRAQVRTGAAAIERKDPTGGRVDIELAPRALTEPPAP
jgi:hypothetical protein